MNSTNDRDRSWDETTSQDERVELVAQLPEPSPLGQSLVEVVAAAERETVAKAHGIDYRSTDHSVRVQIVLSSDGRLPEGYRVDQQSSYQNRIDARVHVDDLVPLSMDDSVRIIRPPDEPSTNELSP